MNILSRGTPLSDMISECRTSSDDQRYQRFVTLFAHSNVGVVALAAAGGPGKVESTAENPIGLGTTSHSEGRHMILSFADPHVFVENYGGRCNGEMPGFDVLRTVLANPDCEGVLVNSATAEVSIVIDRDVAMRFIASSGDDPHLQKKEWWKFW